MTSSPQTGAHAGAKDGTESSTASVNPANTTAGAEPDRIDVNDDTSLDHWAARLAVSVEQLQDAVRAVGNRASDVELQLKGSRSTTNADRVQEAGGA